MPYKTAASDLLHFADGVVSLGDKGTPADGDMLIIQADGKAEFESVSSAGLQPHNANLDAASASPTAGEIFAAPGGVAAWSSLSEAGFGTIATQNANNVNITGGSITGITDLAVADGGTGASTAATARDNLDAARRLVWTATKTSLYTAAAGDAVACNTTGGAFTVRLPATPTAGDAVRVADVTGACVGGKEITVDGNGANVDGNSTLILNIPWVTRDFSYTGFLWKII